MRISSGLLKGRTFYPPADHWPTRPTTDVSREALFNILRNELDFEQIVALDLFGGTGAHSYELVSHGCTNVDYVDNFREACKFVEKNLTAWKIEKYVKVHCMDYQKFIFSTTKKYDYIFAGPPYPLPDLDSIPSKIFQSENLTQDGLLILEHNPNYSFEGTVNFLRERKYGQTRFSFFTGGAESMNS